MQNAANTHAQSCQCYLRPRFNLNISDVPLFALFAAFPVMSRFPFSFLRDIIVKSDSSEILWENVPLRFNYLVNAAKRYNKVRFDDDIDFLLTRISVNEHSELQELANEVKIRGDYPEINKWLDIYDMSEHEEAAAIYFLFGIFDALDFSFEDYE